jgi:N-acetylmuramoyl-L-alanine amidase
VAKGDTLSAIAKAHGVSATDLARWNDISDPRRLRIGQELRLTAP